MIDFENESLLSVAEAAKLLPRRPALRTIWRWIERGCNGVRLETVKIGDRRFTSREALHRFVKGSRSRRTVNSCPYVCKKKAHRVRAR